MTGLWAVLVRELRLSLAGGWATASAVLFYLAVATMTPFAIGPQPELLAEIAAGIAWIAALLASLLTLERLFQPDVEDGSLDQLALSPVPLEAVAAAKIIAHWITTAGPLLLATPVVAILLQLPEAQWLTLLGSLLVGTPALSAIGAVAAALAVGVRRAGVLIGLLVLPLVVPTLIFGVGALDSEGGATAIKLLGAVSLVALALGPFAAAAALRLALD
jgi:heme exporter protein B